MNYKPFKIGNDPSSDIEVAKYLNYMKSWQTDELIGTFKNIPKNVTSVRGKLKITSETRNATSQFSNVAISEGVGITLDNANGAN